MIAAGEQHFTKAENKMWLKAYFVYSDVISIEWSQCQVNNSWSAGLMHMNISSCSLPLHSNPLIFLSRSKHSNDHLQCWFCGIKHMTNCENAECCFNVRLSVRHVIRWTVHISILLFKNESDRLCYSAAVVIQRF